MVIFWRKRVRAYLSVRIAFVLQKCMKLNTASREKMQIFLFTGPWKPLGTGLHAPSIYFQTYFQVGG